MIPELGHYALILALCMALLQGVVPLLGTAMRVPGWTAVAGPAARAHALCVLVAYACLTWAFLADDFSVLYVANHSQLSLPTMYKVTAVWGGHEGSLLLWALTLSLWTGAVTVFSKGIPKDMLARVIGVMGMVSVGFLLFMLLTSNPFDRLAVAPAEGRDLNPLLQDFGLIIFAACASTTRTN